MSKFAVTRLFIGSLIAFGAGAIVAILAIAGAIANNVFVMDGRDIVSVQGGVLAYVLLALATLGGLAAAGGVIAGFVAWIGAVVNTWQLESKAWFVALAALSKSATPRRVRVNATSDHTIVPPAVKRKG